MLTPLRRGGDVALPTAIDAVAIGASAGAVDALGQILPHLPGRTPWPVLVVVHVPANQPSLLPSLFARTCALPVRHPEDKRPVTPGIWFARPGYHMLVESTRTFSLSVDPPVHHSRPSIDVLFESAAQAYGARLVAIVLTGANADGAAGARAIRSAGGFVIAQDPATADVATMPAQTIAHADPQWVASLQEIAAALRDAARMGER